MKEMHLDDLLEDPSFHNWVFDRDEADVHIWETWMKSDISRRELALAAADILRGEAGQSDRRIEQKADRVWDRLQQSIAVQQEEELQRQGLLGRWRPYLLSAASIFLLLAFGLYAYVGAHQWVTVATASGEIRELTLPDGSQLTLNAQSEVTYAAAWPWKTWPREVWIAGEGFFEVTTTPDRARFQVHAGEMQVEVLGTRFNVRNRSDLQDIVLEEGKVKLNLGGQTAKLDSITLSPGDRVVVADNSRFVKESSIEVATFVAWRNRYIVWEGLTVGEAFRRVKDAYGLVIVPPDSALLTEIIQGRIPAANEAAVLEILSELFEARLIRMGDTLRLEKK